MIKVRELVSNKLIIETNKDLHFFGQILNYRKFKYFKSLNDNN